MPTFVHLNGPPGAGKSTIAAALVATRPLALRVDIDLIRTWLGQWATDDASKAAAREIGYAITAAHLAGGRDVVLPQLDIREEVITRLDAIARDHGAQFLEVILMGPPAEFAARIAQAPIGQPTHPRDMFTPNELRAQIEHYTDALDRLADGWPRAVRVDVSGLSAVEATARVASIVPW